jgi:hypothetical protein
MNRDNANTRIPPLGLPSLFRGIYNRVARQLGVDPSYVSRVARGERRSEAVQAALNKEMKKIFDRTQTFVGGAQTAQVFSTDGHDKKRKIRAAAAGR